MFTEKEEPGIYFGPSPDVGFGRPRRSTEGGGTVWRRAPPRGRPVNRSRSYYRSLKFCLYAAILFDVP